MPAILIIEDAPDLAEVMKIVLESKRYQVDVASNGREGLQPAKLQKAGRKRANFQ